MDTREREACYGSAEPEPETLLLCAGALAAELVAGNLRDIRFDGVEVIRGIGYIVRDKDWGTYSPALSNLVAIQRPGLRAQTPFRASRLQARMAAKLFGSPT